MHVVASVVIHVRIRLIFEFRSEEGLGWEGDGEGGCRVPLR